MQLPEYTDFDIRILEGTLKGLASDKDKLKVKTMLKLAKEGSGKSSKELALMCGVSRATLFRWIKKYKSGNLPNLLDTNYRRSFEGEIINNYIFHERRHQIARLRCEEFYIKLRMAPDPEPAEDEFRLAPIEDWVDEARQAQSELEKNKELLIEMPKCYTEGHDEEEEEMEEESTQEPNIGPFIKPYNPDRTPVM
jgi:transposase-like protein